MSTTMIIEVPIFFQPVSRCGRQALRPTADQPSVPPGRVPRVARLRKLSFGTQSAGGSRFVETMLTVIETCRQQSRNVFAYVTAAVRAHYARQPIPSLLPES